MKIFETLRYSLKDKKVKTGLVFLVVFLALTLINLLAQPQIDSFIAKQIRDFVEKENIALTFKSASYSILPPQVILKNIEYKEKGILSNTKRLSVSIQILPLIKGSVRLKTLTLKGSSSSIKITKSDKKNSDPLSFKYSYEEIKKIIPFNKIQIFDSKLMFFAKKTILSTEIKSAKLEKHFRYLVFEGEQQIDLSHPNLKETINSEVKLKLFPETLYLNYLKASKENSILELTGGIKSKSLLDSKQLRTITHKNLHQHLEEININTIISLEDFNETLINLVKKEDLKNRTFSGTFQATGSYNQSSKEQKGVLQILLKKLKSPFIRLEQLSFKSKVGSDSIFTPNLKIELSPKSSIQFNNFSVFRNPDNYKFKFNSKGSSFNLRELLSSLYVEAPLSSHISLNSNCSGSYRQEIYLSCDGKGSLDFFKLFSEQEDFIDAKKIDTDFEVELDAKAVNFKVEASSQEGEGGTGTTSGFVNFKEGFDIEFESSFFDFALIPLIAGQRFKGTAALKGRTWGTSKWGRFNIDLKKTSNFQFNDFFLNSSSALISYQSPTVKISDIKGKLLSPKSEYEGKIKINARAQELESNFKGNHFTDQDLRALFKDSFSFPEDIKFKDSSFSLSGQGNIEINKQDLMLKALASNISAFDQKLKSIEFLIEGPEGKWDLKKLEAKTLNSTINGSGQFQGLKSLNLNFYSKKLKLEDLDLIREKLKLRGLSELKLSLEGPLEGPKALGSFKSNSTQNIKKENLGETQIDFRLFQNKIDFKGYAFNKRIEGEGSYPFSEDQLYAFKGKIKSLDFLHFVSLNFNSNSNFSSKMSFESDLSFKFKNNTLSFNKAFLKDFQLLVFESGLKNMEFNQLQGTDLNDEMSFYISDTRFASPALLKYQKKSKNKYQLSLNGSLNLSVLKALIPTAELMTGKALAKSYTFTLEPNKTTHRGEIEIKNANFKTDTFPYALNNINGNLLFKDRNLLIQNFDSVLNSTPLFAEGLWNLDSKYLNLDLKYNDLFLEFPQYINSKTNGNIKVSGNQLPLQVSGEIRVKEGSFTKDLVITESSQSVSPSRFLPESILHKNSPPFFLNILLKIRKGFQVKSNEVNGKASGSLFLKGNPVDPVALGAIKLEPNTELLFLDKIFYLNEGFINYKDKVLTEPDLFIEATAKVKDSNDLSGRPYNIRMVIEGPGTEPNIKFSSSPPLREKEIISLLTLGTASTEVLGQEINTQQRATYSGLQLGTFLLQKNKALRELQKKTGTEIGIRSSVNSFDVNPTIQVKKAWSPKVSSTVSQSFGGQKNLSFTTEYKFNNKVSSVIGIQNNQPLDSSQLINRKIQTGQILELDLQYQFEFE